MGHRLPNYLPPEVARLHWAYYRNTKDPKYRQGYLEYERNRKLPREPQEDPNPRWVVRGSIRVPATPGRPRQGPRTTQNQPQPTH